MGHALSVGRIAGYLRSVGVEVTDETEQQWRAREQAARDARRARGPKWRLTQDEVARIEDAIRDITSHHRPITVTDLHVQLNATIPDIVPLDRTGYRRTQRHSALMRRRGALPFGWITVMSPRGSAWRGRPKVGVEIRSGV